MADEYKAGLFTLGSVAVVGAVIARLGGPIWYAVGPAIVYAAYFVKLRVRGLRDKPEQVILILTIVPLAMIGFAVF